MTEPFHLRPRAIVAAAAAVALALGGCGGGDPSNGSGAATRSGASVISGWKATDACALLDQGTVAATLGSPVETATLGAVKDEGNGFPLYSQCEMTLKDGRMLVFGAGQYTNGASLPEQVADMKRQAGMISDAPPADVPGLGKAGLWVEAVGSLYAFLGDGRYISATLSQPDVRKKQDPIDTVKAQDMAILRKAGA